MVTLLLESKSTAQSACVVCQICPLSRVNRYSPWPNGTAFRTVAVNRFGRAGFWLPFRLPVSPNASSGVFATDGGGATAAVCGAGAVCRATGEAADVADCGAG